MEKPTYIWAPARDFVSRQGQPIQFIVVHATAGTNSLGWLQGNPSGTSIHVLINKAGQSWRLVTDQYGANHAGFSEVTLNGRHFGRARGLYNPNVVSLGIELENLNDGKDRYTDAQLVECARWIIYWRGLYGANLPVFFHREIDTQGKTDPRDIDHTRLQKYLDQVVGKKSKPAEEDTSFEAFSPARPAVLNDNASVRQGPSTSFERAAVYPKGTRILTDGIKQGVAVGSDPRWFHLANGLGFIHASLVDLCDCGCKEGE